MTIIFETRHVEPPSKRPRSISYATLAPACPCTKRILQLLHRCLWVSGTAAETLSCPFGGHLRVESRRTGVDCRECLCSLLPSRGGGKAIRSKKARQQLPSDKTSLIRTALHVSFFATRQPTGFRYHAQYAIAEPQLASGNFLATSPLVHTLPLAHRPTYLPSETRSLLS